MTQDEIIRMAREVFVDIDIEGLTQPQALERFAALVAAHEREKQAEQEPVGEMIDKAGYKGAAWYLEPPETGTKLYTAPVRTKDLTDDEIRDAFYSCGFGAIVVDGCRAVIEKFKEKNK